MIVSDNESTFRSQVCQDFFKMYGLIHRKIAPLYPATNGQAERYVQTIKLALIKLGNKVSLQSQLQDILIR